MKIKYFTKNLHLTPQIQNYVENKINKFQRISKRILLVRIELNFSPFYTQGKNFKVEIKLEIPGKDLYAAAREKDLLLALDKVEKKMRAQLSDYEDKFLQRRKVKSKKIEIY